MYNQRYPENCTISKNEFLAIDKNAVIRSLNGWSSSLVRSFCQLSIMAKVCSLNGDNGLAISLARGVGHGASSCRCVQNKSSLRRWLGKCYVGGDKLVLSAKGELTFEHIAHFLK